MENTFKQKLADLIEDSDLSKEQKELWMLFMLKSIPDEDEAVFEAVNESKENLILLTKHLRDKILSMEQLKEEDWKELTNNEKDYSSKCGC